jgi:hypothetical protein
MMKKNTTTWIFVFFTALLLMGVFHGFLGGSKVLLTTDAVISGANQSLGDVFLRAISGVSSSRLLGTAFSPMTPGLATVLKGIAPSGVIWNNWVHPLGCFIASVLLLVLLFRRGLNCYAVFIAVVAAFWVGSNFTLLYAGHPHKPYVVMLFVAALIPFGRAVSLSIMAALVWGGCVGLMFVQQPDVAMFFALFSGCYFVCRLWKEQGIKPVKWLKVLLPAAVVAFLFAAGPLLSGYERHVKGSAQMQSGDKQAKWDYVTQWSFPPEEMIAFVAPGYTGWRSGEPEGPYWGRMGRSAGWEQTKQGFQNFKLENTYLGVIPVVFALFALFSCRRSKHRAEILFWGGATVVALLLSFGKFFPLYALFYKLPVVNNIRNPNKFLQVFQVCMAILTAYGVDALFSRKLNVEGQKSVGQNRKSKVEGRRSEDPNADICSLTSEPRNFFWSMVGVLGLFGLWAVSLTMNNGEDVSRFAAQGWPVDAAEVIVQNKMAALWHATLMAAVVTAVFALFSFDKLRQALRFRNWIAAGLVLIVAADAVKLSKHYVKEMPRSYIEANALTNFIQKDLGHQRVALVSQQGIYSIWTTYLLPYNRIPTFNFSDMPRMATDYQTFLEAGQRNPLNMWRFSAVKYLLGPSSIEQQLAGQARKVFSYDLAPGAKSGEFKVVPSLKGEHAVFELLNTSPRYAVTAPLEPLPDEQALASVNRLPRPQAGSAEVLSYRPGKVKLRVTAVAPAMLRVAEKWDADWKASVDGNPAEVQRVDFICQGVSVPAGEHEVILRYAPSRLFFYMQCTGYVILFVSLGVLMVRRKGEDHAAD